MELQQKGVGRMYPGGNPLDISIFNKKSDIILIKDAVQISVAQHL